VSINPPVQGLASHPRSKLERANVATNTIKNRAFFITLCSTYVNFFTHHKIRVFRLKMHMIASFIYDRIPHNFPGPRTFFKKALLALIGRPKGSRVFNKPGSI